MQFNDILRNRNVIAWLLLVSTTALHVIDETLTDFLPLYNDLVRSLRERVGFFPAPAFSFEVWLGGLVVGILLCFGLTILIARGGRRIRRIAIVLAVLMLFNALGHLLGSIYFGRILPGAWSSPLLLMSALVMIHRGIQGDWRLRQVSTAGGV